ncbi:hypothetical protein GUJ93_ZPchr0001g32999 [Zizania palustris]|uniref:Uncharacterized protein n=1 Tax=Zizania palustris TaxID=103762 RepID=A0A8J5V033_ZIZPA|nr:hypothetical protein GUJ93_ZPchr0001g32999 [Zizania palustris]
MVAPRLPQARGSSHHLPCPPSHAPLLRRSRPCFSCRPLGGYLTWHKRSGGCFRESRHEGGAGWERMRGLVRRDRGGVKDQGLGGGDAVGCQGGEGAGAREVCYPE